MNPLFPIETLSLYPNKTELPFRCEQCSKTFYLKCGVVKNKINRQTPNANKYCNLTCKGLAERTRIVIHCIQCNKEFWKHPCEITSKTGNNFCSRSCSVTYNNTHKTTGTRRSKLEKWIEEQLTILYPELQIIFNGKETINSELDIYIPSLNLAFELNGIFHYEPIYGQEKLASIQNNDNRKFQACLEKDIELVIIDSSGLKHFKEQNAKKYLLIISEIVSSKYHK
jgi:hypothetical protein